MPYTLVQHTGYSVGGKPAFRKAVEPRSVSTRKVERRITRAGGLIFGSYAAADAAATRYNFPEGYTGMIPQAEGDFVGRSVMDEKFFVPKEKP